MTAERAVRTLMVVVIAPVLEPLVYFAHAVEDVAIEHPGAHRAVEALDQRVLRGLAGLDERQLNKMVLRPLRQCMTNEFRTVVQSQAAGLAAQVNQLIQCADHTTRGQARLDLDAQCFAAVVIA